MDKRKKQASLSSEIGDPEIEVGDMEGSSPPPKTTGPRCMRASADAPDGGPPVDGGKPAKRKPTTGGRRGSSK